MLGTEMHADVSYALARGSAVVALESTLIAHGLPSPRNLEVAAELEAIVREEGATPATIAVIGGVPQIGLSSEGLGRIASGSGVAKLSVRDLPMAIARRLDGATTVASTAYLAHRAGIRLFATGGLGGVHRGARESWDESADLAELARTPITVVCAGVKSILDVPATLERLETLGVGVLGFGTRQFPGFYRADSGCSIDWSVESVEEAAAVVRARDTLGVGSALVVGNPTGAEQQVDQGLHDRVLDEALGEVARLGISGKAVTPFVLDYFHSHTGGETLRVNVEVVKQNARLAARIAVALTR